MRFEGQQTPWTPSIGQWVERYNDGVKREDEPAMVVQAYCVLNSWPHQVAAVRDGHIRWIAAKYKVTAAQLLLRWALQHPHTAVLVRSSNRDHLLENLNVFSFEIAADDMMLIDGLNSMFSPFDIRWADDVYGQIAQRPGMGTQRKGDL